MQEIYTDKQPNDFSDNIDIREFLHIIWTEKWIVISLTAFVSIIAVIFSLSLPNKYISKALIAPVNSSASSGISGALGNYSGIAGLAGIKLPSNAEDNTQKAVNKIKTLSFFENNILPNIFLPDLMAVKSWDPKTNNIAYDKNIYDAKNNSWVRDFSYPKLQIPSAQESYEIFIAEHLSLNEDSKSGFFSLEIKHQSPIVAKQWTELVVNEVNNFYRLKDKLESEKAASYVNQQISLTSLSEVKEALAQLLQEQTKRLALIESNDFYVFDYIDPPAVMERKSEPRRALICILGSLLGGMFSLLYVLFRHYIFSEKA